MYKSGYREFGLSGTLIKILKTNIYNITVPSQVNDLPTQLEKMDELCHLPGFRHDAKLIEETGEF